MVLGDVIFQDMEVPETIKLGGKQVTNKHLLPGGVRVIDAMGADDDDIAWEGFILGPDASDRARLLDQYRKEGSVQDLSWWNLDFSVIINSLTITWERYYQVRYQITCEVVQDLSLPPDADDAPDVDDLMDADASNVYAGAEALGMDVPGDLPGPVASSIGISVGSTAVVFAAGGPGIDLTAVAVGLTALRTALSVI
jgi:hypothetical protein